MFRSLLVAVFCAFPVLASDAVTAVAPDDSPLLGVIAGDVVVQVTVGPDGQVSSAAAVHPLPFVTELCEKAAARWQFAPSSNEHEERILFRIERPGMTDLQSYLAVNRIGPAALQLRRMRSVVADWSATGGSICPLHREDLQPDILPIWYGLPTSLNDRDARAARRYRDARDAAFPLARVSAQAGCIVGEARFAKVAFCPSCRRARERWLHQHPVRGAWSPN